MKPSGWDWSKGLVWILSSSAKGGHPSWQVQKGQQWGSVFLSLSASMSKTTALPLLHFSVFVFDIYLYVATAPGHLYQFSFVILIFKKWMFLRTRSMNCFDSTRLGANGLRISSLSMMLVSQSALRAARSQSFLAR